METAMIQATEFETIQTIDPREAKLRDIIERGKASLQNTLITYINTRFTAGVFVGQGQ